MADPRANPVGHRSQYSAEPGGVGTRIQDASGVDAATSVIVGYRVRRCSWVLPVSARFGPPRCTDRCRDCKVFRTIGCRRRSFVQFVRPTVGVSRSVECWQRQPLIVSKSAAFGSNISVRPTDLTGPMSETGRVWPVGSSAVSHSIDNCSPPIPNSVTKRVYRPPARGLFRDRWPETLSSGAEPVTNCHGTVIAQFAVTDTSIIAATAIGTGWFRD